MTPLSKSQIDKLGERLRGPASEADLRQLNEFVVGQDPIRIEIETALRTLCSEGESITSRLKTKTSIVEKLQRQHTRLSEMQDIVGVRIVTTQGDRKAQDALVGRIVSQWPKHRVYDRRAKPQHGYRAVHVIISSEGRPVEIQVRTAGQHKWAELFEKVADRWGREVRYGGALAQQFAEKAEFIRYLKDLAENIAFIEVEQGWGTKAIGESFATIEKHLDTLRKELVEET